MRVWTRDHCGVCEHCGVALTPRKQKKLTAKRFCSTSCSAKRWTGKQRDVPIKPVRIEGEVAYVPLTQGYEAIIDAADVPLVKDYNWHISIERKTSTLYAIRTTDSKSGKRTNSSMHIQIMGEPGIDHRDGNGLNNRRSNLRKATTKQNNQNRALSTRNVSGYKGVFWIKKKSRWRASIDADGRKIHLGTTKDVIEAARMYDKAAIQYYGEYARLNLPEEHPHHANQTPARAPSGERLLPHQGRRSAVLDGAPTPRQKADQA